MKRPHQVLARAQVDARLAPDRAVHLRQQRRRYLDHLHATQVGGGSKARHISDDAAAEGNDDAGAVEPTARELVIQATGGGERLRPFAVPDEQRPSGAVAPQLAPMPAPHRAATDDGGLTTPRRRQKRRQFGEETRSDHDVICRAVRPDGHTHSGRRRRGPLTVCGSHRS